jgi:hypothetical protein
LACAFWCWIWTNLACSCRAVQALVDIEQSCPHSEKKEVTSCS